MVLMKAIDGHTAQCDTDSAWTANVRILPSCTADHKVVRFQRTTIVDVQLKKGVGADPLRVLRAIRFGARFGFKLDGGLEAAAASQPVSIWPPSGAFRLIF